MVNEKELNREDIIRSIAMATGYTQKDIRAVLDAESLVIEQAITQGYSVKHHKLYRLILEEKKGFKGFDGLNNTYYDVPDKTVLKFKPLSRLQEAIDNLNNSEDNP